MKHIYTLGFWKDIKGYEDLYQVSNVGQVKSLKRGKILKQSSNGNSYLQVILSKNGKRKKFYVHRLVAEAFLPNEDELSQVDHINNNKDDNRVANLQWISQVENLRKKKTGWGQSKRVVCVETGEVFDTVTAAAKSVNRDCRTVCTNLKGIIKTCAGLHFKYKDDV